MVIRPQQVKQFDNVVRARFENDLVEFSRTLRPSAREFVDDAAELQFVRSAIERAQAWSFTDRDSVQLVVELMVRLGYAFDSDPQFAWAGEIVNAAPHDPEFIMATQLYNGMTDFFGRVHGPENALLLEAYRRIASTPDEAWAVRSSDGKGALMEMLRYFYPQRFDYIGEQAFRHIMAKAVEDARQFGMSPRTGVPLFSSIAFLFGHGALADPQYAWIAASLSDDGIANAQDRQARLRHSFKEHLSRAAAPATV